MEFRHATRIILKGCWQQQNIYEPFRRKLGWWFTAGDQYGYSGGLIGVCKLTELDVSVGMHFCSCTKSAILFSPYVFYKSPPGMQFAIPEVWAIGVATISRTTGGSILHDEKKFSRTCWFWAWKLIFRRMCNRHSGSLWTHPCGLPNCTRWLSGPWCWLSAENERGVHPAWWKIFRSKILILGHKIFSFTLPQSIKDNFGRI